MFDGMSYEKLNEMIENPRSEPFDKYFGEMEISELEKKKRILLAEKLKDNFFPILYFLFTYRKYGLNIDWKDIRFRFEMGYKNALREVIIVDPYMDTYIKTFSYDVVDSTKRHKNDFYYYSIDRATLISENESNNSLSYVEFLDAVNSGKTMKKWIDIRDKKERESHRKVGGTVKPINDPFLVENSIMNYPRDFSFSPSASQVINCRCSIKYF